MIWSVDILPLMYHDMVIYYSIHREVKHGMLFFKDIFFERHIYRPQVE